MLGGPSAKKLAPDHGRTEAMERFVVCRVE